MEDSGHNSRPRADRKTMQLCRQVQRALTFALPETGDDALLSAMIEDVQPAPDASQLLVSVRTTDDPMTVLNALHAHTGRLRSAVAEFITRRKAPELLFQLV